MIPLTPFGRRVVVYGALVLVGLVALAGIRYAWGRYELRRLVAPAEQQNATAIKAIDQTTADENKSDASIAAKDDLIKSLSAKIAAVDQEKRAALAEASQHAATSATLARQVDALQAQRKAQPAIRSLQDARDAIAEAIR